VAEDRTLARIRDFVRWFEDSTSSRTVPSRFGTALYHDAYPHRWDSNFLRVEVPLAGVAAAELAGETDRLFARLEHREIVVRDPAGERLALSFAEMGWAVDRLVEMVLRRPPDRLPDTDAVSEVSLDDVRSIQMDVNRSGHGGMSEPVAAMLVDFRRVLVDVVGARFFLARVDGTPAAYCELYVRETVAQIEDVNTLERFRGRGLARAVVWAAVEQARRAGADVMFLVADDRDWPKHLYAKLGFEPMGAYWQFTRHPPPLTPTREPPRSAG
jgi:GNAT superfamily N-acetyltransferase